VANRTAIRRRTALGAIALGSLGLGLAIGALHEGPADTPPAPEQNAAACPERVAEHPKLLVGQMLIVRMEDSATGELLQRAASGEIGGVIMFPSDGADPERLGDEVRKVRRASVHGEGEPALVAIDQEGGDVERLPGLPPDRSPPALALDGVRAAAAEGRATGAALRDLGIDVDLAPVLDVPADDGAFIASRAFSADPAEVATLGTAFGLGLQDEGVAATAKHFPGLGLASENTDLTPSSIDASRAELEPGLEPFLAAIDAGVDLVMVSNATYPALDPDHPASQSRRIVDGLLRGRLGYDGVVITDDIGAGALTGAGIDEGAAAVGAAKAGADLILTALTDGATAYEALRAAVHDGALSRARLVESCARTFALRQRLRSVFR
jgi:beta-N-acetylhexosaminidase